MSDKLFCKKKNGFTLVEIIAAVIVMGIIAIIAVPSVIRYINDSTETTFLSYEHSMREAAKNHVIKCISDNDPSCLLPEQGEKKIVYLSDLVNSGYIDEFKDPNSENFCESEISYIEISNSGNADFQYTACLYCGDYKTNDAVCTTYSNDNDDPECGTITGESTKWTNTNRKITVQCNDRSSGCISNTFSRTFANTIKESYVTIADKSGRTKNCPVKVYVDKRMPTCELQVTKGQLEATGWYSGKVEVTLKNQKDGESGLLTYGIGTSLEERNYNKGTKIKVNDGITTVMGYVKDKAGNEGICSLDVRVGEPKPEYFVEYGYQIYPNKETYTVANMTQSGNTFTSTSNDPIIAFTGLNEYRNVNRVVVYFASPVSNNAWGQVFYSNGAHSEGSSVGNVPIVKGSDKVEFEIPKGTYNNIRIDLGTTSGLSYNIRRIELRVGDRSVLWTNKDVSVVLLPEKGRYRLTQYSFDNGRTWQTKEYKEFGTNNNSIVTKTKNFSGLISDPRTAQIANIDKVKPTCSLKIEGTIPTGSPWYTTDVKVSFASAEDSGGSTVRKYGIGSSDGSKTVVHQEEKPAGVTYTGHIDDKAGNTNTCSITFKKKAKHTITFDKNGGVGTANSIIATYGSAYGTLPVVARAGYGFAGWYTAKEGGVRVTASTIFYGYDAQTLYAHWSTCTAGTYSTDTISNCTACPTGYTSDAGATAQTRCYINVTAGNHKTTATGTGTTSCEVGTFVGAHRSYYNSSDSCTACPAGYTSDRGAKVNTSCYINVSAGKYKTTATGTTTAACTSGKYKEAHRSYYNSADSCTNCPTGYTSDTGAVANTSCYINVAAGKYKTTATGTTTTACTSGKYKEAHRSYYNSADSCSGCPSGYTSDTGAVANTSCYINVGAGRYKTTVTGTGTAACSAGYYKGAHRSYYNSADTCTACPTGYTSDSGATTNTSCYINVGAGRYKTTATGTGTSACSAGYYKGAHRSYYNSGDSCSGCPSGYTSDIGTGAITSCYINVGAGRYKTTVTGTGTAACSAGYYSGAHRSYYNSADTCSGCPYGYTSDAGATANTSCYINVGAGKYKTSSTSSSTAACGVGTYKGAHRSYYNSADSCSTCPSGYTSNSGTSVITGCFMNVPAGYRLATANASSPSQCGGGQYKEAHTVNYGSTSSCNTCSAGTYSNAGAGSCTACPSGYTSGNGASGVGSCYMSVPAGNYVSFANAWYYNSCNAGTYRGAHTVYYGNTSSCYPCWAGTYSNAGAGSCSSCPSGYTSGAGATSISSCYISVSAGRYLPTANTSSTNACGVGYYSGAHTVYYGGTSGCTYCGAGKTTSGTGSTSASACYALCSAGYTHQPDGTCKKTYAATVTYSCPSGGTVSGSICDTSSSYAATGSYSEGCSWSADSGHMSKNNNQGNCIYKADLPSCNPSNSGLAKDVYDCGRGKISCKSATKSTYNCTKSCDSDLKRYTYKVYTCECKGTLSYSCPSGGYLSGTTCYISSSYNATPNYNCNPGDSFNGSVCVSVYRP